MIGKWMLILFLFGEPPLVIDFNSQASCINAGTEIIKLLKNKNELFSSGNAFLCLPDNSE